MAEEHGGNNGGRLRIEALEAEVRTLRQLATLGRLASGVAHDFNNQLTSILGYADLLLATANQGEETYEDLLEIRRAAERATVITQQMLAFARPHTAQPGFINLADIVMDTVRLLRRVLGPDIQLTTSLPAGTVVVQADPVHVGHALLHLAMYARDRLPRGGTLAFELSAKLAAMLTLQAIPAAGSPPREPDTTAPSGGLDIVVQFIEQNGGRFHVTREGGLFGAAIQFPTLTAHAQSVALRSAPPRGHETVMVVEDDSAVRTLIHTLLERHGYRVIAAEHPRDALTRAEAVSPSIDLLIVDLVLPGMTGEALAADMQKRRTGVRVLYVSGEPNALAADQPPLAPTGFLLSKPFAPNHLLLAVRPALDTTPEAA